jgi:hypothetical protein
MQFRCHSCRHFLYASRGITGTGHWAYLGMVSRLWRRLYSKVCRSQKNGHDGELLLTSYKSACSSISKLEYAVRQGLDLALQQPSFPRAAGRYAPEDVLLWATENGMPTTSDICTGAAEAQRFELLKRLHVVHGFPWTVGDIARVTAALEQDTLSVLKWLWEQVRVDVAAHVMS